MNGHHTSVPSATPTEIRVAVPSDLPVIRRLFAAYFEEIHRVLGDDLGYQNVAAELEAPFARLERIWISEPEHGIVGVRRLADGRPEMKRLYVSPSARGGGLGHKLCAAVEHYAREQGDRELVLDTVTRLEAACALYEARGYRRIDAYIPNPFPDARFYSLPVGSSVK